MGDTFILQGFQAGVGGVQTQWWRFLELKTEVGALRFPGIQPPGPGPVGLSVQRQLEEDGKQGRSSR